VLFSRIEHVRDITDLATSLNLKPFALVRKVCIGKEVTGGLEPCPFVVQVATAEAPPTLPAVT
jgi:hypothetical protein